MLIIERSARRALSLAHCRNFNGLNVKPRRLDNPLPVAHKFQVTTTLLEFDVVKGVEKSTSIYTPQR